VAVVEDGKRAEDREHGEVANTPAALAKLLGKLGGPGVELNICYEAGPCGYGIQRQVAAAGHSCAVVAPSLIPQRPGDRIKTDHRDAVKLARLHRAGEPTPVWVPDSAQKAMRDLVRARLAAVCSLRHARQQLSGFLLRHGHHYHRPAWTQMHRRWLSGLRFAEDAHHIVLEDCIATVEDAMGRRDRLTIQIEKRLADWMLAPVVEAVQAALVAAATIVAELGDQPLLEGGAVHVLSGAGAVGRLQWQATPAGREHEGRQ
jgi:transposase